MKQVILEYAGAVIAVLGAISFFLIFDSFFVGKEGVLGQMLQYSIGEKSLSENEAFDQFQEVSLSIIEKKTCTIAVNQRVLLAEYFEARDGKGGVLPVYMKRAWELDGTQTSLGVSEDGSSICASKSGVYWMELYVEGANGKQTSQVLKILVNER